LIEPEIAKRFGYHLPPLSLELAVRESVWAHRSRLQPAERRGAYDDGQGECRAKARDQLRKDIPDHDQSRLYDFSTEAFRASLKDPEAVKVFGNWSACMTVAGFHYSDPLKPYGDAAWAKSRRPLAWALKEFG
jgi:hypothetical protein